MTTCVIFYCLCVFVCQMEPGNIKPPGFFSSSGSGTLLSAVAVGCLLVSSLYLFNQNRQLKAHIECCAPGNNMLRVEEEEEEGGPEQEHHHRQEPGPSELHDFFSGVAGEVDPEVLKKIDETVKSKQRQQQQQQQQ